jgi:hypothetical protein
MKVKVVLTIISLILCMAYSMLMAELPWPQTPEGNPFCVNSAYGPREADDFDGTFFHGGIDLNDPNRHGDLDLNEPIRAAAEGTIKGIRLVGDRKRIQSIVIYYPGINGFINYFHIFPNNFILSI